VRRLIYLSAFCVDKRCRVTTYYDRSLATMTMRMIMSSTMDEITGVGAGRDKPRTEEAEQPQH
jgi:hypothetical protein